jgi:death-on-curing protein
LRRSTKRFRGNAFPLVTSDSPLPQCSHKQLIERSGDAPGIRDIGALESALHRPQTGYYDTIIHEAAALLESLVQIHAFIDENTRTAFAVVDVFLRINGYANNAGSGAIFGKLIKLLDQGAFDMEHLVPWLEEIAESA